MFKIKMVSMIIAFGIAGSIANARISIQACQDQPIATQNIKDAITFIAGNIDDILNDPSLDTLSLHHKDSFRDMLFKGDFPIVCRKDSDSLCTRGGGSSVQAYTIHNNGFHILRGRFKRGVYLCKAEISIALGCDFYSTIAHEIAHLADLPIVKNHNDPYSDRTGDQVFALDESVRRACVEADIFDTIYYIPIIEEIYQGP